MEKSATAHLANTLILAIFVRDVYLDSPVWQNLGARDLFAFRRHKGLYRLVFATLGQVIAVEPAQVVGYEMA